MAKNAINRATSSGDDRDHLRRGPRYGAYGEQHRDSVDERPASPEHHQDGDRLLGPGHGEDSEPDADEPPREQNGPPERHEVLHRALLRQGRRVDHAGRIRPRGASPGAGEFSPAMGDADAAHAAQTGEHGGQAARLRPGAHGSGLGDQLPRADHSRLAPAGHARQVALVAGRCCRRHRRVRLLPPPGVRQGGQHHRLVGRRRFRGRGPGRHHAHRPAASARRRRDVLLDLGGCHLDRGRDRHLPDLAGDCRHRRRLHCDASKLRPKARAGGGPGDRRSGVRPARRSAVSRWPSGRCSPGTMPTLRRWVDSGTHHLQEWTVQLPCTTPASQQGILHGTLAGIPAFRWYDRELGRVLVANKPADALVIEERASTGLGLLADDGVSISNLFSGDAATNMLTMSRVKLGRGSRETREAVARFVLRPDGLARSFARTTAEALRERFQARQQRRRAVVPRMHRSWTFAFLRAVSNGVLRDLNMALVTRQMLRGARSIYVDFVDYDEVAHHAGGNQARVPEGPGVTRRGAQRARAGRGRRATQVPLRRGLGPRAVPGSALRGPLRTVAGRPVRASSPRQDVVSLEENVESWGRVGSVVDDLAGDSIGGQTAARASTRLQDRASPDQDPTAGDLVVLGSGNLGLVYVPGRRAAGARTDRGTLAQAATRPGRHAGNRVHRRTEPHAGTSS